MACWRCLASDESLSEAIIDNFLRLMTSIELYEDPYHVTETHIAALQPLTLISALGEMLQVGTMKALCIAKFSDMFTVLYTTLACYLEAAAPAYTVPTGGRERFAIVPNRDAIKLSPAKITVHTFNAFLDQADCQKGTLCELAALLAAALAGPRLASCVARLARCARAPLPPQRCAAAALLANLLDHRCNEKPVLAETILATLSTGWKDENARVRAASLRGAANVARLPPALRPAALPAALSALSQGIDAHKTQSPIDNVPLAAIQGLSRLLTELETLDKEFDRELLSISQKIRPFMNTECAQLREASIRLFGIIASRVSSETLIEQAVSSLPCFLLHLCDNNPAVVRASKFTLREVFKTLKVKKSNDFVQAHLVDEGRLYLDEFLGALLRQLAEEMPRCVPSCLQAAVNYLHCTVEEMKPHPPLLLGLLYAELYRIQEKTSEDIDLDPDITKSAKSRLLQLIKDPNPAVRQNSALALANICLVCAHHG
ncbi:HEAT repeat-containing protein 7A [Papilio xuthus]|uniref:HEAT repeat-containing protein 7A n=1 Tax=Papilio xuthus TaxID=66420 RepID=A0A194PZS5_PAPXU|nr:HEAT repeat-containing protein 7A [Papilio xuthus]